MSAKVFSLLGVVAATIILSAGSADASAPAGRYLVAANGTVYDTKTKLTWQQTAPSTTYTWAGAVTYCSGVGASLGGTGWRLPTVKELQTIVDDSRANPAIDTAAFPATPASPFWSYSQSRGWVSTAYTVDFNDGRATYFDESANYFTRCVR